MTVKRFYLIFLIKLVHLISNSSANEVSGCGGFIKSHADLDFSKVEVGLFTSQGSLKIKTDCSPSNGYYFIPLYDKGDYVLKVIPPHGWSFEPQQVSIKFDGISDDCSLEKDVNFIFKGFGITGKIGIFGKPTGGAKGVKVELKSEKRENIGQTVSDNSGVFSFTPIVPGKYFISVSHEKWYFLSSEITVIVETGNTEIPSNLLVVSGYDVEGKVLTDGQSFGLVLYNAKGQKTMTKCSTKNMPQLTTANPAYDSSPICYTTTNKINGEYVFNAISPGKYLIAPYYDQRNIKFHIKPEFIEIEVLKDGLKVSENFEVTGFSVSGRVLLSNDGHGVQNANIRLNGREIAVTDENGIYILENIQSGTYTIQVSGEDMEFKDHTVRISLANPTLPDIIVSGFKVCGQVISKASQIVAITKEGSTFHTEIPTREHSGGDWCIYLSNGHYLVQVLTSESDKSKGVQFFPLTQTIEVNSSPVSGIIFSQLRATVRGSIKCLPDDDIICNELSVTLNGLDVNGQVVGQPSIASMTEGSFSFVNVLPGNYEITVPKSKLCWEQNSFRINIKTAEETVPTFVQTGYVVSIVSSHLTTMGYKFQDTDEDFQTILLNAGLNSFCVLKAGIYDIQLSGCHRYDSSNVATSFSTKSQSPLNINAYKHKNVVRILANENVGQNMIVLKAKTDEVFEFLLSDIKQDGYYVYQYDFYLENDESVELEPKSDVMLFKPENRLIVGGNDCVDGAFNFIATKGLLISGNTIPAIPDVKVTMLFPKNPELSPILETTDANGQFKFGPIDPNLKVIMSAEKESYVFSEFDASSNTFKGHKLCEIIVNVVDESGKKLPGVLLTLSGGESYRKNLVTGEDGTVKFHSLSPSQYYLKAMMKEYKFEPNSKLIDVQEGVTVIEELKAIRVAFSIFGAVTTLNREPFPNVIVEAITDEICNYHQEEATSEPNGHYRIRGLQPGCEYKIRIKSDGILVDRSIPIEKSILVGTEDIRDENMIAISPLAYVDVAVRVKASQNEFYKSLKIVLYKKGTDNPVHSQRIESPLNLKSKINSGIMVFFPRIPFDRKTYYIELTTTLSDKTYKFNLPVVQFTANTSNFFTEIEFNPEIRSADHDLNQNSLSAIILIVIVGIIFFKQDLAIEVITMIWTRITNAIMDLLARSKTKELREEVDNRDIDQLASSINSIKKKKTKKVN